jgi:hypothetical protein
MQTDTAQAADNLTLIAAHWDDLHDALTTRQTHDWPPTMGLTKLREPDEDGDRLGDVRSLPIRADVFDAMQHITSALVELADQIAAEVQRPTLNAATGKGWTDPIHREVVLLAARDAADTRRWRYTGQRTAPQAAAWLHDRLAGEPGPFRPLHDGHRARIADIAAACAITVQRILRTARQAVSTGQQCACGGEIEIHGGDGTDPAVKCASCGRTWTPQTTAA